MNDFGNVVKFKNEFQFPPIMRFLRYFVCYAQVLTLTETVIRSTVCHKSRNAVNSTLKPFLDLIEIKLRVGINKQRVHVKCQSSKFNISLIVFV